MRLTISVDNMKLTEEIHVWINDVVLPPETIARVDVNRFESLLAAPPLRRGVNEIVVLPGAGSIGRLTSTVTSTELSVRYRQRPDAAAER